MFYYMMFSFILMLLGMLFVKYTLLAGYLVSMLLVLEMTMILNMLMFVWLGTGLMISYMFMIYFFLCNVMEACLGLSLVVLMSRQLCKESCSL